MNQTTIAFRIAKLAAVFGVGLLTLIIAFSNTTDYYSNFAFVEHVMKMDTTFESNKMMYRAINSNIFHHIAYIVIIALEALNSYCCLRGAWQMYRNINKPAVYFHTGKRWAIYGLTLGIFIWFIIFQVAAGEWFLMWQSSTWNGLYSSDRLLTFITMSLIMLMLKEDELQPQNNGRIRP